MDYLLNYPVNMIKGKIMIKHEHKILKIIKYEQYRTNAQVYCIRMDCPVQPLKTVMTTEELKVGQIFDPHFSNPIVIARFAPTDEGWTFAKICLYEYKKDKV